MKPSTRASSANRVAIIARKPLGNSKALAALLAAALLSLPGCASPQRISERASADAAAKADAVLASLSTPYPANLLSALAGPVAVPADAAFPASAARRAWNEDRARLRACVATHAALASEVRNRTKPAEAR
jgi:hypothetical protein